jgi:hypothetical protein
MKPILPALPASSWEPVTTPSLHLLAAPRPSLLNAFVLASFSHTLNRSIRRSMSFRASSRGFLSLTSAWALLMGYGGEFDEGRKAQAAALCLWLRETPAPPPHRLTRS